MSAPTTDFSRIFRAQSEQGNDVHHYALVDSAQNPELTSMLGEPGACLFGSRPGTPIARVSPHLVRLPRQQEAKGLCRDSCGTDLIMPPPAPTMDCAASA